MAIEGSPHSLTHRIEQALLARHPVTLPPERARNYAEIATAVAINDRLKLLAEIEQLRGTLGWLHEWSRTVSDLQNSDAHQ